MDILSVRQILVALVHNIGIRFVIHEREQTVAVTAYHLSVSPCDAGSQQSGYLYIAEIFESPWKLNWIVSIKDGELILAASVSRRFFRSISVIVYVSSVFWINLFQKITFVSVFTAAVSLADVVAGITRACGS